MSISSEMGSGPVQEQEADIVQAHSIEELTEALKAGKAADFVYNPNFPGEKTILHFKSDGTTDVEERSTGRKFTLRRGEKSDSPIASYIEIVWEGLKEVDKDKE